MRNNFVPGGDSGPLFSLFFFHFEVVLIQGIFS
jgi:hypothetical protein